MDTRDLVQQLETALDGATAGQRLEVLGKLGVELTDDEFDLVSGGVLLEDGRLHDLLSDKLAKLTDASDGLLSALDNAIASIAPNGLMGR